MDVEPRNTASDLTREHYPKYSRLGDLGPEGRERFLRNYTEGFVREDRRRFVAIPSANADELFDSVLHYWDLGSGPPTFGVPEVVAVRGDRCVLFRSRIDYENGASTESLVATVYSADWKSARSVMFDPDDVEAAVGELDQLYEMYEAQSEAR